MEMESLQSTIGSRLSARKKMMKNPSLLPPFLPDEIITNVLSRLPVKFVIRFGLVCKGWSDLTMDHYFVDLNFKHSLPLILSSDFDDEEDVCDLKLVDKWWEPSRSKMIHTFTFRCSPPLRYPLFSRLRFLLFSQGGLIVSNEFQKWEILFIIFNPIYPAQTVRITLSGIVSSSEIYGVFFHPSLEEYCSLLKINASDIPWRGRVPRPIHYMILTLGSNPSLKNVVVSNLLLDRDKKFTTQSLLIGNYLYWMLESRPDVSKGWNDIMKFDIMSEEFIVLSCPVPLNTDCSCNQTHLLDIDGVLSYLLVLPGKFVIWRLKDHKVWTRSEYNIIIEGSIDSFDCGIAVVNGKFAFLWNRTFYVCNLVDGKCRKTKKIGWCIDLSHQMSLASLKNCKPTISIHQDRDKKVVVVEKNRRVK